jgi:hypothetical protein
MCVGFNICALNTTYQLWTVLHFFAIATTMNYHKTKKVSANVWFCYVVYNSCKFNGFNNCALWPIIVVITLVKCAHQTSAGVWERHTCIGPMKSTHFVWKNHLNLNIVEHVWVEYHVPESNVYLNNKGIYIFTQHSLTYIEKFVATLIKDSPPVPMDVQLMYTELSLDYLYSTSIWRDTPLFNTISPPAVTICFLYTIKSKPNFNLYNSPSNSCI